jgi:uncharacterized protein YuzE
MITLSIDTNVDAAHIELTEEPIVQTVEVTPNVQVDIDATGTVVGVELLSLTAELPIDALDRFVFPSSIDAQMLLRIWPSISYRSEGQGGADFSEL